MKNVVLIGASGFVGTAILNELLNRGHKVTAIVRDLAKVTASNPNLKVVQADVTDTDVLIEASKGKDAVISAYNPGWKNPNIYEETLKNYPLIVDSVKKAGVERLLIVGGAGTLFYAPGKMVMDADDVPAKLLPGIKSLGEFYLNTLRKENDIDWIFLSPAANMTPGERTGKFRIGYVHILHRMFYIASHSNGSVWLSLCLYNFSMDTSLSCTILNSADGQTLELEKQNCKDLLSDREKEILQLINKGKMSKDIAQTLSISINTVNRHRQNILEKLQVNNSIEACRIAKELHLL